MQALANGAASIVRSRALGLQRPAGRSITRPWQRIALSNAETWSMTQIHRRDIRALAVLVVAVALAVIPGAGPWSGPVLMSLTQTHGVHLADLGVVALGLVVAALAMRSGLLRAHLRPDPHGLA